MQQVPLCSFSLIPRQYSVRKLNVPAILTEHPIKLNSRAINSGRLGDVVAETCMQRDGLANVDEVGRIQLWRYAWLDKKRVHAWSIGHLGAATSREWDNFPRQRPSVPVFPPSSWEQHEGLSKERTFLGKIDVHVEASFLIHCVMTGCPDSGGYNEPSLPIQRLSSQWTVAM